MPPTAKWIQYKTWSGILVGGETPVEPPIGSQQHMDRVVFLTSQLEAPKWGGVQSYDGAGISGGLLHNIAVMPASMEQGSLFALVRRMFDASLSSSPACRDLEAAFANQEFVVARDGKLRHQSGLLVDGGRVRGLFAPPEGKVPKSGPQRKAAERWALLFHAAFADPATYRAQMDYAIEWLSRGQDDIEREAYRRYVLPKLDSPVGLDTKMMPPAFELAMCVYHAFSVNGPGPAASCLRAVLNMDQPKDANAFAAKLIRRLGKSAFGRWLDEPGDGGNRYDRTRRALWAHPQLWDRDLARSLMPRDL